MANPRQRSKSKSHKSNQPSLNQKRRLHQKLRRKPDMNGPGVLQESWDKKKTVFQNYAALGLLPNIPLPPRSSSRSYKASLPFLPPHLRPTTGAGAGSAFADEPETSASAAPPKSRAGYGRIVRDEEGNVIDIIIDQEPEHEVQPEGETGMEVEDEEEGGERRVEGKTDVVRSLEALAATSAPVIRHPSTSEHVWLGQLVQKYGDDSDAMARDLKLNVWQKTAGEIRRMIKKAGGAERLRA
ncbi:ribosomal large subunit biogenesis-related protein [Dioszegia hungarica]|uniref:Nucleolar protein 16 n=1 Tax=Dioszegia hungarica TaxID=4972 RepID=A0AA38H243_9TREE|nr:ribosomal large subunit biogenesis-related protein [Dioszegia hungarica]KAI9633332.1 ribosomal large subunit biogenesis-related protein [Dioszegia hungarica]